MYEWEDEALVCTNCGDRIHEGELYFRYEDDQNFVILCETCMEDARRIN